jgi:hypothetical protein
MLKEHLTLFWRLRSGTKKWVAKFVRCYLEQFLEWDNHEIHEKIKPVGYILEPDCDTSIRLPQI